MGLRELEAAILAELREVANDKSIRQKDIMQWETGRSLVAPEGEVLYRLPRLGISVCVKPRQRGKIKHTEREDGTIE